MKRHVAIAAAFSLLGSASTLVALYMPSPVPEARAQAVVSLPLTTSVPNTTNVVSGSTFMRNDNAFVIGTPSSGGIITITAGSSGLVYHYPRPRNARFHAVTDTYFDENGKVIGKETVAHNIDPNYCQPGHRPDNEPRIAMPLSVRQLVAEAAEVESTPTETTLPVSVPVKYAEVK